MREDEIPDCVIEDGLLAAVQLSEEQQFESYGRGQRQKREVNYKDQMTDHEFSQWVESGSALLLFVCVFVLGVTWSQPLVKLAGASVCMCARV